jgi:endonuclease-3
MTPAHIETFFARLSAQRPAPQTELAYINGYTLLVAVVLSAQATDKGVNKATQLLFENVHTPAAMVALGEDALRDYLKTLNHYKTKARHVVALSQQLLERFGGAVPATRGELMSLPGVGRKTANVVLSVLFNAPVIAVDTHIFRVSNRTGLAVGKTPLEVELNLEKAIPPRYLVDAHHWLILHGRYTCKAVKPLCASCVVRDLCAYEHKTA